MMVDIMYAAIIAVRLADTSQCLVSPDTGSDYHVEISVIATKNHFSVEKWHASSFKNRR